GFEVAPTTVELSARNRTAVLRITNRGPEPVTIQAQPYDWSQAAEGEALAPSAGLQVSPPMAQLAPGAVQIIRLPDRGPPGASAETAHRLIVSELPAPGAAEQGRVRVRLQFSLPVFGPPTAQGPPPTAAGLSWSAARAGGELILTAANAGPRRAK